MVPSTFLVDGIKAVGLHNGVVRIAFVSLTAEGEASEELRLLIPRGQVQEVARTLSRFSSLDTEPAPPERLDPTNNTTGTPPFALDDDA